MTKRKTQVKRNKSSFSLKALLHDKKKRYIVMFAMMLPFLIAIGIFGATAYREGKALINLAKGEKAETKAENIIQSMNYILRDNPTDLQKEYFAQLKKAVEEGVVETEEGEVPADDAKIVELVAKNYIVDFYTWTNKRGQYDIGGLEYVYDGEFENGDHFKENVFLQARDGFYKFISVYGTKYGKENLIEVSDVQVTKCQKMTTPYVISEHDSFKQDADGEWYDYRVDVPFEWYVVQCNWTYKENEQLNLNQFAKSINLAIIKNDNRFEIVEASEKTINARKGSEQNSTTETTETTETTSTETSTGTTSY